MENIDIYKLANGNLPKWPQMLVTGKQVTVEQAKEIIFRTDNFLTDAHPYSGGNAREFNKHYRKIAGLDLLQVEKTARVGGQKYIDVDWDKQHELQYLLQTLGTSYVTNNWASSSYIGGPHGWCSPDGVISYSDNVGKWPSIEDIIEDWSEIATAFPYLDLHVTLMSGEDCEDVTEPVINIRVVDGKAFAEAPDLSVHDIPVKKDYLEFFARRLNDPTYSLGLPMDWYEEFAARVNVVVKTLLTEDAQKVQTVLDSAGAEIVGTS